MATNTGIGVGIGIPFKDNTSGDKKYISPDVLSALCGVWIADQNTNESSTRNTIKNKLKGRGGDFKILNAAYKDNSGYGLYKEDFTKMNLYSNVIASYNKLYTNSDFNTSWIAYDNSIVSKNAMKISIKGIPENGFLYYWYVTVDKKYSVIMSNNGTYELPASDSFVGLGDIGFNIGNPELDWTNIVIEQIPDYQGSFVTNGVDDLIVSEKSVSDILGGSNEITVISMIHQIDLNSTYSKGYTNVLEGLKSSTEYMRTATLEKNKTGIYGYTYNQNAMLLVTDVLGDKNDYERQSANTVTILSDSKFSVEGGINNKNYYSSVAFYWTFIANKVLTSDQINQVIEYFNLDKYVKPDVLYNVKKQGITNDNHAQFGDKLIDYSGNGRDMQLYNIGWKGATGISAKEYETLKDFKLYDNVHQEITIHNEFKYTIKSDMANMYWGLQTNVSDDVQRYITIIADKDCTWKKTGIPISANGDRLPSIAIEEPVLANVPTIVKIANPSDFTAPEGFTVRSGASYPNLPYANAELTIEIIPSYKGALLLDGVNDYGKVTNMPIYKDYTVVVDREALNKDKGTTGSVLSKSRHQSSEGIGYGAFIFEIAVNNYSFNTNPTNVGNNKYNKDRMFSYLSKYSYNGVKDINVGTATDSTTMWLGTIRDLDNRFSNLVMRSLMCFPYSLSKFLINRQISNNKLFDDNVVELMPVLNINEYESVEYYNEAQDVQLHYGDYIPKGSNIAIKILMKESYIVDSATCNGEECEVWDTATKDLYYIICKNIRKYPQMIKIKTSRYITYEQIIQPYPAYINFVRIIEDEEEIREIPIKYGYTLNEGTKIKVKSVINLLPSMYFISNYICNGETLNYRQLTSKEFIIGKDKLEFGVVTNYLLDNEPKCILSPEKLNMPNSAYEALGYIPDISGNGNHGYIYNSAYNETSGMNEDGSFKLDGVNDFIKLDTLSVGGQQVLMKCKWSKTISLLYDQGSRLESDFAILTTAKDEGVDNDRIAYNARNRNGYSYIDGIWNQYVETYTLQDVIHNITITNDEYTDSQSPVIGKGTYSGNYAEMSLYTFMLFDEISTDDEISYLNTIVGVEPKIEFPPYYYDNHGRSNLDENKVTLDNLGTGGVHPLVAQNIAFEGMSGYGGYTFPNFSHWAVNGNNIGIDVDTRTPYHIDITNFSETESWHFCNYAVEGLFIIGSSGKIKLLCNKDISFIIDLKYRKAGDTVDNTLMIIDKRLQANTPTEINWTYKTQEELNALGAISHWYLIYFWLNKDITYSIDMLPEYPNAILLDGVNDTLRNTTIPALTDFTCIVKREEFGEQLSSSVFAYKGGSNNLLTEEKAFMYNYKNNNGVFIFSFDKYNNLDPVTPISYITPTSANGRTIVKGTGKDTIGLTIGKWSTCWKGAFYKMLLWDKTLDNLSINMIKNLIEKDGIIDIHDPIFK